MRMLELAPPKVWKRRPGHIVEWERMLVDEGTTIVKVFLNISKEEQRVRLQERIDDPEKRWKFRKDDLAVRARFEEYIDAYEDVIEQTSSEHAPWYVVPADRNWVKATAVAELLVAALETIDPQLPSPRRGSTVSSSSRPREARGAGSRAMPGPVAVRRRVPGSVSSGSKARGGRGSRGAGAPPPRPRRYPRRAQSRARPRGAFPIRPAPRNGREASSSAEAGPSVWNCAAVKTPPPVAAVGACMVSSICRSPAIPGWRDQSLSPGSV